MKLFLDDTRIPKEGVLFNEHGLPRTTLLKETDTDGDDWFVVRNFNAFVRFIIVYGVPEVVSFDHDLTHKATLEYTKACNEHRIFDYTDVGATGLDCAKFLVAYCKDQNLPLPKWYTHSFNHFGRVHIAEVLEAYDTLYKSKR